MIIDRMRHLMEDRLGGKTNPAKRLKDAFVRFDRNGDGKISHAEFKDGLADLKVSLGFVSLVETRSQPHRFASARKHIIVLSHCRGSFPDALLMFLCLADRFNKERNRSSASPLRC